MMQPPGRRTGVNFGAKVSLVVLAILLAACDTPPPPSPSPTSAAQPTPTASPTAPPLVTPPPKVVGDLALEMCEPEQVLPCEQQAVVLVEPVAATGVALTYSTEWADGRLDRPAWNADSLGLGGWSLDVLQRYDTENGALLMGDGSWRLADAVQLAGGERAVPTHDGLRYFVFDGQWRHVRTVDSVTGATLLRFEYDDADRVTSVAGHVDAQVVSLAVERDSQGSPTSLAGVENVSTRVALDSDGRLVAVLRPNSTHLTLALGDFGLIASSQSMGRGAVAYTYDATGRLSTQTDADGVVQQHGFESSAAGLTVTTTYPGGGTAMLHSARVGDVIQRTFTNRDGTVTRLDTNADGSTTYSEADGTLTTTGSIAHPTWGLAAPILSPLEERRPDGTIYRVELSTTMATQSPEPAGGAWRAETLVNGNRYVEEYDPATRTLRSTDPSNRVSLQAFDENGRLVEQEDPGSPRVAYAFDELGRLSSIAAGEPGSEAVTSFAYEAGEVIARRPDGSSVRLLHDQLGNLVGLATDAENISLMLDNAGEVMQLRPGEHAATAIGYSAAGRVTAFIPPATVDDLSYETTTYTPAGDLATIEGPGERRIELQYDGAGRVTGLTYDRGTATASYGAQSGLLEAIVSPDGVTTSFLYDGWVPTGLAWSGPISGEVRRTVDSLLQPSAETVNGAAELTFGYDASGRLTSIGDLALERDAHGGQLARSVLGEVAVAHEYDANGWLVGLVVSGTDDEVLSVRYGRDALGRVTSVERTGAEGAASTVFTYDSSGRLASVQRGGALETYEYDASGNRLSEGATYDDRDRLTAWGGETFRYDPDGTLLERRGADGTATYDFDDLGALTAVVTEDGTRIEYVLDADGRRIGRRVDGRLNDGFLYDVDDRIVAWTDGAGDVLARFGYDDLGRLALVERDGLQLLVVTDQIGSPIALFDGSSGELVAEMSYDAWGNVLGDSQPEVIPIGFAGGLLDPATGLLHFGLRDYDPSVARWTAPDPLRYGGGDLNLYRYVLSDPVNLVDPSGTVACAPGSCGSAGGGAQKSAADAGGKTRGGRRASGGGKGGGKPPPGALSCSYGVCRPANPSEPYRPSAGERCILGDFCVPSDNSTYPGNQLPVNRADRPEGLGSPNVFGEPHVITLDGVHYDFQAAGEFVVAASADGAVQVQARFETPPSRTNVTRTTAMAVQVNGDRVAVYAGDDRRFIVNGEPIDRAQYTQTLPGGGLVERFGTDARVVWPDGTTLTAQVYGTFINFGLEPSDAIAASIVGLVGNRDGDPTNDLATREGVVIDPQGADFSELLYAEFGNSWRITQAESLFDYLPGESTETFTRPEIPTEPATVESLDPQLRAQAETLCRAMGVVADPILSACLLDVGLTGDPTYAASAAAVNVALERSAGGRGFGGTPVELGQSVEGNLVAGTAVRYTLDVEAGQIVYLDALGGCVDDLRWWLFRPNGTLATFDLTCTDLGRRLLAEAGAWTIEVYSDLPVGGAYSFRIIDVPAASEASVALDETVSGQTRSVGEWHRYRLAVEADQIVYLDALGECVDELRWRLLRPDGVLSTFDLSCTDLGRRVLDEAGAWIVEVYSEVMATGPYSFRVIGVPAVAERSISIGESVSGQTESVGERHSYQLEVQAGQIVYFDALGDCVPDLRWQLLRPDGVLSTFDLSCRDLGRRVLAEGGTWTIEVYADLLAVGSYSFRVIGVPAVQERSISIGQSAGGEIASVGELHRYTFSASAGQVVHLEALGDCVDDLRWWLLTPDGSLSTFDVSCVDLGQRTLESAGNWTIEIYSDGLATGSYSFRLSDAP